MSVNHQQNCARATYISEVYTICIAFANFESILRF